MWLDTVIAMYIYRRLSIRTKLTMDSMIFVSDKKTANVYVFVPSHVNRKIIFVFSFSQIFAINVFVGFSNWRFQQHTHRCQAWTKNITRFENSKRIIGKSTSSNSNRNITKWEQINIMNSLWFERNLIIAHITNIVYFTRKSFVDIFAFSFCILGGDITIYRNRAFLMSVYDRQLMPVRYVSFSTDHQNGMIFYYNCLNIESSAQRTQYQKTYPIIVALVFVLVTFFF